KGFRLVLNDVLGNALERRPPPPAAVPLPLPLPRLGSLHMPSTEDVQQQLQVRRRRHRRCGLGTGGVARALAHRRHHLPQLPLGDDDLDADDSVVVVPSLLDGFRGPEALLHHNPGAPRQDSALHGRLGLPLRLRFSHILLVQQP
ncbi:unnamed protein product, partial [Musa hybrid cultivar]